MTCMSCVGRVTAALESIDGATDVSVVLEQGFASFSGIPENIASKKIQELGYSVGSESSQTPQPITLTLPTENGFNWRDGATWKQSAHNTKWCLVGCSIGDFGTIAAFQFLWPDSGWNTMSIMGLAMINGILTSIALETFILLKQMGGFMQAFRVAIGMSLISMIGMEAAMNLTDLLLTGGAMLTWWVIPFMLLAGFVTPWPYNYWRLKKYGISCH